MTARVTAIVVDHVLYNLSRSVHAAGLTAWAQLLGESAYLIYVGYSPSEASFVIPLAGDVYGAAPRVQAFTVSLPFTLRKCKCVAFYTRPWIVVLPSRDRVVNVGVADPG